MPSMLTNIPIVTVFITFESVKKTHEHVLKFTEVFCVTSLVTSKPKYFVCSVLLNKPYANYLWKVCLEMFIMLL